MAASSIASAPKKSNSPSPAKQFMGTSNAPGTPGRVQALLSDAGESPRRCVSQRADGQGGPFIVLRNCSVVNVTDVPTVDHGQYVVVRGKRIVYVGASPPILEPASWQSCQDMDLGGRYVLPGLCDAHVHVTAVTADLREQASLPTSLVAARATGVLKEMLMRGFTTVRDVGGCDWGLAKAVEEGTILGPRILFSGHALSQTGGHGDFRSPGELQLPSCCGCPGVASLQLGRVCDGVAGVRVAAREELRRGAHQLKVMASGGVASPTDHISNLQFSEDEIRAIVEEAENAGTYVSAHAYTPQAIQRALHCGVRSIEHGNLLDEETAEMTAKCGAFLVPTLVTYDRIRRNGEASGMGSEQVAKVGDLLERGMQALQLAERKGVNICFGSDLLGSMHIHQLEEISLRAKVQTASAILRGATWTAAKLFRLEGHVGMIAKGAFADLLVVDVNPLDNIDVLLNPANLRVIMKEGKIVKQI